MNTNAPKTTLTQLMEIAALIGEREATEDEKRDSILVLIGRVAKAIDAGHIVIHQYESDLDLFALLSSVGEYIIGPSFVKRHTKGGETTH